MDGPITMRFLYLAVLILMICELDGQEHNEHDADDWIDPFDMVNFDHSSKTMKNKEKNYKEDESKDKIKTIDEKDQSEHQKTTKPTNHDYVTTTTTTMSPPTESPLAPPTVEKSPEIKPSVKSSCKKDDVGSVILKKFLKNMLDHFSGKHPDSDTQEYNMWIHLTKVQMDILSKYGNTKNGNIHDVDEVLSIMIHSVTLSHRDAVTKTSMWFESRTGISLDNFLKVLALLTLASILTSVELHLNLSIRQRATKLIVLAFIISIPMTWYELYKEAEIEQQTVVMKNIPANCVKNAEDKGWLDMIKSVTTFKKDECQEYYQHMLIEPLVKVPPTKAVALTFARFFLTPLKDIGKAFSEFLQALFQDLPVTFYPVAIGVLPVVLFLFLFMWFGYSVRLPFSLGSIEPTYNVSGIDSNVLAAIEENSREMKEQMKALENVVKTTDQAMNDKMLHMEKIQMAAIEYTAATSSVNCPPPTLPLECGDSKINVRAQNAVKVNTNTLTVCSDSNASNVSDSIAEAKRKTQTYHKNLKFNQISREPDDSVENVGISCTDDTSASENYGLNVSEHDESSISSDIHDFHVVSSDNIGTSSFSYRCNDGVTIENIQSSSQSE